MQPKGQESRGGTRRGSGRKPQNVEEKERKAIIAMVRRKAKDTGRSLGAILADRLFDEDMAPATHQKYVKLYLELIKDRGQDVNVNLPKGPVIGLPELVPVEPPAEQPEAEDMH